MKITLLYFSQFLLRFFVAVLIPPLLTVLSIGLFEKLARAGIKPYKMYSFSDQAFLSQMAFMLTMAWGGVLLSAVTGLAIFVLCEKFWLPKHNAKKIKQKVIIISLIVYIGFIVLMQAFLFLQPIFFVPVVLVAYFVTSLYVWLYKRHHNVSFEGAPTNEPKPTPTL